MLAQNGGYCWPVWRYEVVCGACGAHLYAPEDACCLYCGGGELRELGQRALICRMDARTGEVDCTEEEAHGTL